MSDCLRPIAVVVLLLGLTVAGRADTPALGLSDPTRPPQPAAANHAPTGIARAAPDLRLQAVFTGPKGDAALINGQLVTRGQRIAGALLRQVHTDGVLLERDGQTWEMSIGAARIKQPAGPNRRSAP